MPEIFIQKKFPLIQKHFELTDEGLSVKSKSLTQNNDAFLKYEDIGGKIVRSNRSGIGWLILAAPAFIYLVIILMNEGRTDIFDLILFIFCIVMYFLTDQQFLYLAENDNRNIIRFYANKPSKEKVENFVEELKSKRKEFLVNKYGQLSRLLSYEQQFNNLQWLNRNDVLSQTEYEAKLQELNDLFKAPNQIIGFGISKN